MGGSAWRVCPCELCANSSSAQSLMLSFAHAVPTLFYLLNYMTLFLCRLFLLPCSCCYFYPPKRKEKNTKTNSSPLWAVMTSGFCFYQRLGSWFHWSVPVFLERGVCVCSATACCSVQINRLFGLLAIIRLLNALKPAADYFWSTLNWTMIYILYCWRKLSHRNYDDEQPNRDFLNKIQSLPNCFNLHMRQVAKCVEPDDQNMSLQDQLVVTRLGMNRLVFFVFCFHLIQYFETSPWTWKCYCSQSFWVVSLALHRIKTHNYWSPWPRRAMSSDGSD